jgi:hypothetical protein
MAHNGLVVTNNKGKQIYIEEHYQAQMASHGKVMFDPFCRNPSTRFIFTKGTRCVDTNIAQLRFFRFAITSGLIKYAINNFRYVEELMSTVTANKRKKRRRRGVAVSNKHTNLIQVKHKIGCTPKSFSGEVTIHEDQQYNQYPVRSPKKRRVQPHIHVSNIHLVFSPPTSHINMPRTDD